MGFPSEKMMRKNWWCKHLDFPFRRDGDGDDDVGDEGGDGGDGSDDGDDNDEELMQRIDGANILTPLHFHWRSLWKAAGTGENKQAMMITVEIIQPK